MASTSSYWGARRRAANTSCLRWLLVCATTLAVGWSCLGRQAAVAAAPVDEPPGSEGLDLTRTGAYRAGRWEYRFTITAPGSKSEGARGELLYDGKPVERAAVPGHYYRTPWGDIQWVGDPVVLWGEHGWMPREPGSTGGQALVEPWRAAGSPVVMAMVLSPEGPAAEQEIAPWVRAEMTRLGAGPLRVERTWFPLTDQALVIHDTKRFGTLTVRLAQPRDAAVLTVLLDGSVAARVDMARADGATRVVRHVLDAGIEPLTLYLALRVSRAAPGWPVPLEIGPEANGKVIEVRGAHEVVIALPGDRASGNAWIVTSVVGDSPRSAPLRAMGQAQFVPAAPGSAGAARGGTFENVLRVVSTGRCSVELEYRRLWQRGGPAEKTFSVVLQIEELRSGLPMRWPDGAK